MASKSKEPFLVESWLWDVYWDRKCCFIYFCLYWYEMEMHFIYFKVLFSPDLGCRLDSDMHFVKLFIRWYNVNGDWSRVKVHPEIIWRSVSVINCIGLHYLNDDACPTGHINRPTQVVVSHSCPKPMNKPIHPIVVPSFGNGLKFHFHYVMKM